MQTNQEYIFENFIKRVQHLDKEKIINATKSEIHAIEDPFTYTEIKRLYTDRLVGFLTFLEQGNLRPDTLPSDIILFNQVAESLVNNKQMSKDCLRVFEGRL